MARSTSLTGTPISSSLMSMAVTLLGRRRRGRGSAG
ncbi:MYXO-CTERM sorting domain-containing protein [Streptomyces gardneri]